ncbi:SusC/RagA family TonB-linked outer membrane protein [Flavobacterium gawalongense]|uniref:SusC/RagA family TonB-linked outer membrane protein n=1 Tax=Flavobacterium gawalongense TaxID=2594432 RepID=A0A553BSS5_9FLAO|nr:SusC/RagA family TonB-linked outer membrane protein [Flavobacterium gawalongense]TRX03681.1 SusC/RagA family TonB-linked outer membrane protein [Flavobacterium gawalongense]TRX08828.1 SusC/RagA family TonB-linked outer membrane protein [Flavobacterium gawalongense]TRX11293.1 SusC/RagA family TonB-linked outer membrane protein [Flavobacterium gawalongense]TRX12246.1 SusC/RagA family TonB-linked outer membrane protein [Flavobacterium gawalongense]TRX30215.1 SusC/RagA family TonB-linked outer 
MRNFIFSFLALILLPAYMSGQVIKGKVLDKDGIGIPGAMIIAADSKTSADTDFDGNFNINAKVGEVLKISMVGFDAISVNATSGVMNITLKEAKDTELKEVVVIGYGTRKKIDNTTAITSLKAEEISKTKVLNASQAIQGKAAGVQVISSDLPGSTPSVVIRGLGTALGGRTPLFIVDGMPTENINNINTNDITSYEILKDASSLAIYGTRAANGVIIITTKKGKGDKVSVEFESFAGFREPLKKVKMAGSNKYAHYSNAALQTTTFSQDQPLNTDWFDAITRTGSYNQNNVSVSGGTENIKYFFSLGNYQEKAILNGLDYSRTTFRNNNEYKISKKLTLNQNFSFGSTNSTPKPLSAFTNAYKQSPIVPVRFPNGQYGVSFVGNDGFAGTTGSSFNNVGNPVAQLDFFNEKQKSITLQGGLKLDYEIVKALKFTSQFNGEYYTWKNYNFEDTKNIWLAADPSRVASQYSATANINLLTKGRNQYFNWNLSNYFTYNKIFGEIHDIEVTGGIETSVKGSREQLTIARKNVNADANYWSLKDVDYVGTVTSYKDEVFNENKLASYFGRFQYKLMDRYLFTGTIRRDGSSNFGKDYRWGTFPAFGLGWIVTKEEFLANAKAINLLKLRGGWGKLGNQNVPLNNQAYTSGLSSYLGGSILNEGTTINSQVDPSLSWEITEEASAGVDFELLDNRLKGSFDVYDKKTTNVILNTKPYTTSGISNASPAHVGEVSNKGYEVALRWDDKLTDNLSYWIGGNFSNNKNELTGLKNATLSPINGGGLGNGQWTKLLDNSSVGQPLGSFFMYEYAGLDAANGKMLYFDANGAKVTQDVLAEADKKYVGSILPTSTYGVTLGLNYKNFDLSVDGYGTSGAKVYNGKKAQRFTGENIEESLATNFWTPNNTTALNPAPFNLVPVASTYYLESGDFFRINNITLGYKIPLEGEFLNSCRIYVNAINPFITQKFSGFSPELNGNGDPYGTQGIELDAYPTLRSFVIGANLKF